VSFRDAKVSVRVIPWSIQLRLYGKSARSKRFAKHLGHVYFCARLARNFEAYVRAEARQRRKQPALFLLSHCNNNDGDVCYFAQTASTLAQGWRRNESCCETVAVRWFREVFFYGLSFRRFASQFPRTRLVSSTAGWWSSFFTYAICTHR